MSKQSPWFGLKATLLISIAFDIFLFVFFLIPNLVEGEALLPAFQFVAELLKCIALPIELPINCYAMLVSFGMYYRRKHK